MKTWRIIGISVAAAGLLVYPVMKLVQFIADKRAKMSEEGEESEEVEHPQKAFTPNYRGKHKPHHRHANGHVTPGLS